MPNGEWDFPCSLFFPETNYEILNIRMLLILFTGSAAVVPEIQNLRQDYW